MSKARSILSKTFLDNIKDANEDVLNELVVKAELKIKALEEEKKNDERLNAAQEIVEDLKASYTSVIKMEKSKIQHLIEQIKTIQEGRVNPNASV